VSRFDDFFRQWVLQKQFQDYHETLINDAKSYHYHKEELSDLELLLELQHYGAPFWAKIRLLLLKLLFINCNLSHSEKILSSLFGRVNLSVNVTSNTL
jgi:hypothetical protein